MSTRNSFDSIHSEEEQRFSTNASTLSSAMDAAQEPVTGPRKLYIFSGKCKYLSPHPCKCCPEMPKPHKHPWLALPHILDECVKIAKRTAFRMEYPQYRIMGVELKLELAK